jgi:peptidoglycan/LPS O-acetylase OafA/YrhL
MPRWPASLWLRLPVLFGSRLSYSLYLVHLPVFTLWAARISNRLTAAGTLGVIGAALLATLLLHRLVEAPCIALRDRMRPCPPAPQASQATQSGATQSA